MLPVQINLWGVVAATAFAVVVGAVWYSQYVLGKPWMKAVGKSIEDIQKQAGMIYLLTMLCWLVVSYILAHFVNYAGADTWTEGAITGLWIWAGFVFPTNTIHALFSGRSRKLLAIDLGYTFIALIGMGIILVLLPV